MGDMNEMRLRRRAAGLRIATRVTIFALPAVVVAFGELAPAQDLLAVAKMPGTVIATFDPGTMAPWQRHVAVLVSLVPVAFLMLALRHLACCFGNFAQGHTLTAENARHFSRFGAGIAIAVIASLITTPALSVILTLGMPVGERQLAIGVDSNQFVSLLVAGGAWIVGAIMAEGARAAEENAQFV
ncbi:MAG: hypothetical protein PHS60_03970 [Zavarzinia sp.]|nr:hypothetical protein [Zavarzinia sp.]